MNSFLSASFALALTCAAFAQAPKPAPDAPAPRWESGLPNDPAFFPIGVWLQDPKHANAYKQIGINVYVALWRGPTESQLKALQAAGMYIICPQNDYALELLRKNDPLLQCVVGWMHQDEPDNAQRQPDGKYGPPVAPGKIVDDYQRIKANDPSRPVYLNLGQGVAWDDWVGRGVRRNKPEDYPQYIKGTDIVSFDIYPAASDRAIRGELWRVGHGVKRLREWAGPQQPLWSFIECTRISGKGKATPQEVRSMVWMALVNGASGIEYFVHEWADGKLVSDHQLLEDTEMRDAVMRINQEVRQLAPILNSPSLSGFAGIQSSNDLPIDVMVKRHDGALYLFAVAMRGADTHGRFTLKDLQGNWSAEVLGEDRVLPVRDGILEDDFGPWGVRLYKLSQQ